MIDCEQISALMPLGVGGDLRPVEQDRYEAHLCRCAECAAEAASFAGLRATLQAWGRDVPDPTDEQRAAIDAGVMASLSSSGEVMSRIAWLRGWLGHPAAAAALILCAALSLLALPDQSAPALDASAGDRVEPTVVPVIVPAAPTGPVVSSDPQQVEIPARSNLESPRGLQQTTLETSEARGVRRVNPRDYSSPPRRILGEGADWGEYSLPPRRGWVFPADGTTTGDH